MSYKKLLILFIVLNFLFVTLATSVLKLEVDKAKVSVNEEFLIKVELGTDTNFTSSETPVLNLPEPFKILSTTSSTNISILNNTMFSKIVWNYTVVATKKGKYEIGPVYLRLGSKTLKTDKVKILVVDAPLKTKSLLLNSKKASSKSSEKIKLKDFSKQTSNDDNIIKASQEAKLKELEKLSKDELLKKIKPVKRIVLPTNENKWLKFLIALLMLILAYYLFRKSQQVFDNAVMPLQPRISYLELAKKSKNLQEKAYYLKQYLKQELSKEVGVDLMPLTTKQILHWIKRDKVNFYKEIFRKLDRVIFAGMEENLDEIIRNIESRRV